MRFATALVCLAVLVAPAFAQSSYDWVTAMKAVHANFTGQAGTISRFGDSISVSMAYFMPLNSTPSNMNAAASAAITWLHSYSPSSRPMWTWQNDNQGYGTGADYQFRGMNGGTGAAWALQTDQSGGVKTNIQKWLDEQNPELAVIMWGTNDARHGVSQTTYINNMRTVIQTVKAKGAIPIVTTASPVYNYQTQSANFAQALRDLCATEKVPLIDFYNEIVTRQPGGAWNGTLMNLNDVHPSYTAGNNFSASSLNTSGYTLRNYLTLLKMNEVYQQVIVPEPASLALLALGGLALLRKRR